MKNAIAVLSLLFLLSVPILAQTSSEHEIKGTITITPGLSGGAIASGEAYSLVKKNGVWVYVPSTEKAPNLHLGKEQAASLIRDLGDIQKTRQRAAQVERSVDSLAKGLYDNKNAVKNLGEKHGKLVDAHNNLSEQVSHPQTGLVALNNGLLEAQSAISEMLSDISTAYLLSILALLVGLGAFAFAFFKRQPTPKKEKKGKGLEPIVPKTTASKPPVATTAAEPTRERDPMKDTIRVSRETGQEKDSPLDIGPRAKF